ncbi:VWA domain-containing protein [Acidobacteriota bacterium]
MKRIVLMICVLGLTLGLYPLQQHEVSVINVSVPVRVYDGDTFVDDLTIDDFEVYQDGVLQKIEALYLADKTDIARREETRNFMPVTSRRFIFMFMLTDINPRIDAALEHFFLNVLQPGDIVDVQTPVKNYSLSAEALKSKSREKLADDLKKLIRRDIQIGSSVYRNLIKDLTRFARSIGGSGQMQGFDSTADDQSAVGLEYLLTRYRDSLSKLEELRTMDEGGFLRFASSLRRLPGQKVVFFFYQREFRPELHPRVISRMQSQYQDDPNIQGALQDLMSMYRRYPKMDMGRMTQVFADADLLFNFMYLHKEPENVSGIRMTEQSEDVFKTMSDVALATGGVVDSSQNPESAFKSGVEKCENYYLLYYNPQNYTADGTFKSIDIKIKGKNYKLNFRKGFIAQ